MATAKPPVTVNGVDYRWPKQPVVVVCVDGGDPAYLERGLADGILPHIAQFMTAGFSAVAQGTVPSFTCPNNISLITGATPAVHGISGNFYLDDRGEAVPSAGRWVTGSTRSWRERRCDEQLRGGSQGRGCSSTRTAAPSSPPRASGRCSPRSALSRA